MDQIPIANILEYLKNDTKKHHYKTVSIQELRGSWNWSRIHFLGLDQNMAFCQRCHFENHLYEMEPNTIPRPQTFYLPKMKFVGQIELPANFDIIIKTLKFGMKICHLAR